MKKDISIIVAMDPNHGIGYKNQLPWNIPDDLKMFKSTTMGGVVIMGRKTFQSIGKPLPGRINIVISRQHTSHANLENKDGTAIGVYNVSSIEEALNTAEAFDKEVFIIGGGTIYDQAYPYVNKMYISQVKEVYKTDTKFVKFVTNSWEQLEKIDFKDFLFHCL